MDAPQRPSSLCPSRLAIAALLLSLAAPGCATQRSVYRAGDLEVLTFRRHFNNVHLIRQAGAMVLIDSGLPADAEALDADLRRAGVDPRSLRAIILTHGHADHAGGAPYFQQRYGTPIIAGRGDQTMLARGTNDRLCPTGFVARQRLARDQGATFPPVAATTWIEGEVPLQPLAGMEGRILPLPGHTPGSLVVLVPGAVFAGDLLRGSILGGGAEVHFYICDVEKNRRDIHALLGTIGPSPAEFFVGHFGPLTRAQVAARFP